MAVVVASLTVAACSDTEERDPADPHIQSLADLSVERLRERRYGSTIRLKETREHPLRESWIASYDSDGLHVYTRVDVPASPPPAEGFPVVIFVHGWVGIDAAPALDFYYDEGSHYSRMVDAYMDAGFVVFTPGWRGHGTVDGVPADGIEFLRAWDNGSYLSPVFYAIDVLNLLDGLQSFGRAPLDPGRINLVGHSQGGDVSLIALAVAGEGSRVANRIHAASIWSGTFAPRFTQLETYWPMQTSAEAFMSGDGTWNGTAIGADGELNENFVFGYPPDWIGTIDAAEWTWQKDTWSESTVADAVRVKLEQMYAAINDYVGEIDDAGYELPIGDDGTFSVRHDPRVAEAMRLIGGFDAARFLTEPLALHYSDRDFYSKPEWNAALCRRVTAAGGTCFDFQYPENTHALGVSEHRWFSSETAIPGFSTALSRDISLFRGDDPAGIAVR